MYVEFYEYMEHFLNQLLCGFRKAHLTQHALFKLLQKWQNNFTQESLLVQFKWTCQKPMTAYLVIY